jgi:hypothetical protein
LVDEENKDDQYRSNINKFFSKENTKESKEDIDKEKLKSAEEVLLKETNVAIKQQALNTCIDTLSSCLNIQLSDTENLSKMILEEKKLEQDNDGMTLKIDGNMNGKDVVIYYNLVS